MYDTVSQIVRTAFIGLGNPEPELMTQSQLAEIVFERLWYYYEFARQSDQNVMVRRSVEFQLDADSDEVDLTALIESEGHKIVEPLWCERKLLTFTNADTWVFVPTVNTDTITDRRLEWIIGVSYYGPDPKQLTAKFSVFGSDLILQQNAFRIWYSPQTVFTSDINQDIVIPENLAALVIVDVKIQAFAQMQVEASKYIDKRPELAARMKSWDRMTLQLGTQKVEWLVWYKDFVNRSRSAHRAVDHIDVLGQHAALNRGQGLGGW